MRSLWIISSSIVCSSLVVDAYASGFRDPMGHARLCGKFGVFFWSYWQGKFNSDIWNLPFDVDFLDEKKSALF